MQISPLRIIKSSQSKRKLHWALPDSDEVAEGLHLGQLKTDGKVDPDQSVALASPSTDSTSRPQLPSLPFINLGTETKFMPSDFDSHTILEPHTPEEQVFRVTGDAPNSSMSVPGLTPDTSLSAETPDSSSPKVKLRSRKNVVNRKPVPPPAEHDTSEHGTSELGSPQKIVPLRLTGHTAASNPVSKIESWEICGFCDMPIGSSFRREGALRMECHHVAHRECHEALLSTCRDYSDAPPKCTICDGTTNAIGETPISPKGFKAVKEGGFEGTKPSSSGSAISEVSAKSMHTLPLTGFMSPLPQAGAVLRSNSLLKQDNAKLGDESAKKLRTTKSTHSLKGLCSLSSSGSPTYSDTDSSSDSLFPLSPTLSLSLAAGKDTDSIRGNFEPSGSASDASVPLPGGQSTDKHSNCGSSPGNYRNMVKETMSSNDYHTAQNDSTIFPLSAMGFASEPRGASANLSQIALWLNVPEGKDSSDSSGGVAAKNLQKELMYRNSARDIHHAFVVKREIESLLASHKSESTSAQLGLLRLFSQIKLTCPEIQSDWSELHAYLFEYKIVMVARDQIMAIIDLNTIVKPVMIDDTEPTAVLLRNNAHRIPALRIQTRSRSEAYIWAQALSDGKSQFPVHPENYAAYVKEVEGAISKQHGEMSRAVIERTPIDIVICLPYNFTTSNLAVQLDVIDIVGNLGGCDRLAFLLYSQTGVEMAVPLRRSYWPGWNDVLDDMKRFKTRGKEPSRDNLRTDSASSKSANSFATLTHAISAILEEHDKSVSTASVVIVADNSSKLSKLRPTGFKKFDIPVHTVGITECHDVSVLSMISQVTGGMYSYSRDASELSSILKRLLLMESQYITREVVVKVRARIGAEIMSLRCTGLNGSEVFEAFDKETRTVEWRLRKMRQGDIRCLLFDIYGSIPYNQPVAQVSIETGSTLRRSTFSTSFRVYVHQRSADKPMLQDNNGSKISAEQQLLSLFEIERAFCMAFEVLEEVLAALITMNHRSAFQKLSSALESMRKLRESQKDFLERTPALNAIYKLLDEGFDKKCDAVMEAKSSHRGFVLETLEDLWVLDTRRPVSSRGTLATIFQ